MNKQTAAPQGVSWGTTNTPDANRIDPTKTYATRTGKRVTGLSIVLHNACGNEVTFPVKGTIVIREFPLRTRNQIWTLDGRASVLSASGDDLVEVAK